MELDDLKRVWADYDRKLEVSVRLNTRILRDSVLGKVRSRLTRLTILLSLDVFVGLVAAVWLGGFLWAHAGEARFLIPAVALQAFVVLGTIAVVHQLATIGQLDYDAPIVEIQRRLGALRVARIREWKWTVLCIPLVWTPLAIVGPKGLLGVDIYAAFGSAWVAGNVLFGFGASALMLWAARRFGNRIERLPWLAEIVRDLAGSNLNAATGFLRSLAEFEQDAGDATAGPRGRTA